MAQSETPKPIPDSPNTCSIACVGVTMTQDGGLLQSQEPTRIQPPRSLSETPTGNFTDSGYGSLSTTPREKPLGIDIVNPLRGTTIPLLFLKKKKLVFIDKPTDQPTRDRFKTIQPYFEKLLLEEIRGHQKPGTKYKPISTRLAMMGTSENDAQPHIAILCQPEQKRLIQAFIKKDIVVDIYRPKDLGVPTFDVIVVGNAPRLRRSKSNIEVVTDVENLPATPRDTLCGIPISFQDPSGQRRNATCGGIIKVVTARGSIELLGITAGHMLREWDDDSDENTSVARSPQTNDPVASPLLHDCASLIDSFTTTNETDEDEDDESESDYVPFNGLPSTLANDGVRLWDFQNLTTLGKVFDVSKEESTRSASRCYDWVLFRPILYNMNQVPANPSAQLRICDKRPGTVENRPVIVLSSSSSYKVGSILSDPGRILLGGEEFIDTFMVSMSEEQGIRDGDSGSWVVDATLFEVYGQLVASDMFGSGYVIPMTDILNDVKSQIGARTVELPSFIDILHARTIAEEGRSARNANEGSANVERGVSITALLMALASEEAIEEALVMKEGMLELDAKIVTDRSGPRRLSRSQRSSCSEPKYPRRTMSSSISPRPSWWFCNIRNIQYSLRES